MLKILQARLQQDASYQMFKLVLEKAEEPEIKLPTSVGSSKKATEFQKNIYFCFIDYAKDSDCMDHNKLWKILKERGISDHLTCLLRNLHPGQEATVRTGHETMDWFKIGKGVCQDCILSPCLFNLYADCVFISHSIVSILCDPMDCILTGSSVHETSQARMMEWGCHFLMQCSTLYVECIM